MSIQIITNIDIGNGLEVNEGKIQVKTDGQTIALSPENGLEAKISVESQTAIPLTDQFVFTEGGKRFVADKIGKVKGTDWFVVGAKELPEPRTLGVASAFEYMDSPVLDVNGVNNLNPKYANVLAAAGLGAHYGLILTTVVGQPIIIARLSPHGDWFDVNEFFVSNISKRDTSQNFNVELVQDLRSGESIAFGVIKAGDIKFHTTDIYGNTRPVQSYTKA